MKAKELLTKDVKELQTMLKETRSSLNTLTFGKTTKPATNHREMRKLKKTIARILTVLSAKAQTTVIKAK